VINHGDVFYDNILYREKDEKIFLIDHEYFTLNLLGYDIAYYLVESFVKYEPELEFEFDKINFDTIFPIYENFINKFNNTYQHILEKEEFGKVFLEIIKTKEYFIRLMNDVNLYLFVWTIGNIDFDNWEKNSKKEFFFVHGIKRIEFYLLGKNAIEKMK
jgi:thiamine kinase-like enzyme